MIWSGFIAGEPASKANSRKLVTINGRARFIKSAKARGWMDHALLQLAKQRPKKPILSPVSLVCTIWYTSERPDLDEALVMDALQHGRIIGNDRQIREKHVYRASDRNHPRVKIELWGLKE